MKVAVDTNVLIRAVVRNDPAQANVAAKTRQEGGYAVRKTRAISAPFMN